MTASTKDLIERLLRKNEDGTLAEITEADQQAAADALERLTQPAGVEPVAKYLGAESEYGYDVINDYEGLPEGALLYSAETVARLIAERDIERAACEDMQRIATQRTAEGARLTAELAEANRKHVECVTINERLLSDIRCAKAEVDELRAQEPVAFVVMDEDGPGFCAGWESACHEHINDAINEHGVIEAAKWKVLPVFSRPVPAAQAVPGGWHFLPQQDGSIIVRKDGLGAYLAGADGVDSIASEMLRALAADLIAAAPQLPASDDALLFAAEAKRSGQ